MFIGGLSYVGVGAMRQAAAPLDGVPPVKAAPEPAYFKSISSISPSSLASAYKAIRAHEAGLGVSSAASEAASPAILSGVGLGTAFDAYRESGASTDS